MKKWWTQTSVYQIYPLSFKDSNGDGKGDIQGIIQKLDYIQQMGYETIWCSPFFKSPLKDHGYDISDYREIDPLFGTLQDAEKLIAEVHARNMKILFDMVMNHTSDRHTWFMESASSKDNPKADWYIWSDKPNNWKSMTGGSGWHYHEKRQQYYWASFLPFQPDLNYRNAELKSIMLENVRYWLERGVDGFRLDIFNVIYKDAQLRNNPFSWKLIPSEADPAGFFQEPKHTVNQEESFAFAQELRALCDEYGDKILLGEVFGKNETIRQFLGTESKPGLTLVFIFKMLRFQWKAKYFYDLITDIEKEFAAPLIPVYCFSNHDRARSILRIGNDPEKAKLLHALQLTLRGVPVMYQGEEIGMRQARIANRLGQDPIAQRYRYIPRFLFDLIGESINRDECRTPMQWDNSPQAGFSVNAKTWLTVQENYHEINVAAQQKDSKSLMIFISKLLHLRKYQSTLQQGSFRWLEEYITDDLLAYERKDEKQCIQVILNFGTESHKIHCEKKPLVLIAEKTETDGRDNYRIAASGVLIILRYEESDSKL